jgi:hypothetical protein
MYSILSKSQKNNCLILCYYSSLWPKISTSRHTVIIMGSSLALNVYIELPKRRFVWYAITGNNISDSHEGEYDDGGILSKFYGSLDRQRIVRRHIPKYCSLPTQNVVSFISLCLNPSSAELNPICCLLALLGAHHFLHFSRIRVKSLTLSLLTSYIYIYIYIYIWR